MWKWVRTLVVVRTFMYNCRIKINFVPVWLHFRIQYSILNALSFYKGNNKGNRHAQNQGGQLDCSTFQHWVAIAIHFCKHPSNCNVYKPAGSKTLQKTKGTKKRYVNLKLWHPTKINVTYGIKDALPRSKMTVLDLVLRAKPTAKAATLNWFSLLQTIPGGTTLTLKK